VELLYRVIEQSPVAGALLIMCFAFLRSLDRQAARSANALDRNSEALLKIATRIER
jgi:hypothetical protein